MSMALERPFRGALGAQQMGKGLKLFFPGKTEEFKGAGITNCAKLPYLTQIADQNKAVNNTCFQSQLVPVTKPQLQLPHMASRKASRGIKRRDFAD